MAIGRYTEGRGLYQDPLNPNQGSASALLTAGVMATMFYTPIGGKVISGALSGIMKGFKAGGALAGVAGRGAARFAQNVAIPGAIPALRNTLTGVGKLGRAFQKPLMFMGGNRGAALGIGLGIAAIAGTAKGMMAPTPEATKNISYESYRGGISPTNLSATGDLVFSLHDRR